MKFWDTPKGLSLYPISSYHCANCKRMGLGSPIDGSGYRLYYANSNDKNLKLVEYTKPDVSPMWCNLCSSNIFATNKAMKTRANRRKR